jgi:hypothetical protein
VARRLGQESVSLSSVDGHPPSQRHVQCLSGEGCANSIDYNVSRHRPAYPKAAAEQVHPICARGYRQSAVPCRLRAAKNEGLAGAHRPKAGLGVSRSAVVKRSLIVSCSFQRSFCKPWRTAVRKRSTVFADYCLRLRAPSRDRSANNPESPLSSVRSASCSKHAMTRSPPLSIVSKQVWSP